MKHFLTAIVEKFKASAAKGIFLFKVKFFSNINEKKKYY
jgi:hypothetical protein